MVFSLLIQIMLLLMGILPTTMEEGFHSREMVFSFMAIITFLQIIMRMITWAERELDLGTDIENLGPIQQ